MLDQGIDVNEVDSETGNTALIMAGELGGLKEVVALLLKNGADVNLKDNLGRTALDLTADDEIVEMLSKAMN